MGVGVIMSVLFGVCIFVCFFKQKTAYEMRISDWSSDVCSSDLPRSDHYNTESGVIIYDHAFADELRQAILRDTEPQNAWVIAPRRPVEIGRASCRERVCQYV